MKLRSIVMQAGEFLNDAGIEEYQNDAWLLFEYVFGISRTKYLLQMNDEAESIADFAKKQCCFNELLQKRSKHIPLQHLIGQQNFMGLDFLVNEHVLIPRQDTEILVEYALNRCHQMIESRLPKMNEVLQSREDSFDILDMCTGSGCIAISMKKLSKYPVSVTAADLSEEALKQAKANTEKHQCEITLIHSDLFENLSDKKFDMILSNPPYIKSEEIQTLMEEVRSYEPLMALDGDADGLKFYRSITKSAEKYLKPNGYLIYEIGCDQAEEVSQLMRISGFKEIEIKKDLAGLDRVVAGRWKV